MALKRIKPKTTTKKTTKPKTVTVRVCVAVDEKGNWGVDYQDGPRTKMRDKQVCAYLEKDSREDGQEPVWIEAEITIPEPRPAPTVQAKVVK